MVIRHRLHDSFIAVARPFFFFVILLLLCLCARRERANPLDPKNPVTHGRPSELQALAGDEKVMLRWDYRAFEDVWGYHLYRRTEGRAALRKLTDQVVPREITSFLDTDVVNGTTYFYRIGLLVEDAGETELSEEAPATPGPEECWVLDALARQVIKLSPDGRNALLQMGDLPEPVALSVDRSDGSCWVADRSAESVYRISTDGKIQPIVGGFRTPSHIAVDPKARLCWIVDTRDKTVLHLSLADLTSPAPVKVDVSFDQPASVAPWNGLCWISDSVRGRVILYPSAGGEVISFSGLKSPDQVVVDSGTGDCWVLEEYNTRVAKLSLKEQEVLFRIPVEPVWAMDVDGMTGDCWISTGQYVYLLDSTGSVKRRLETFPGVNGISIDEVNRRGWLIAGDVLWKIDLNGSVLSSLRGFLRLRDIAVYPG